MTNIYNKGRFRSGEWAKHLRPYLKAIGNRRWRRATKKLKNLDLVLDNETIDLKTKIKSKKTLEVKFKIKFIGDKTYSYRAKYRNLRAANDSMKRNNVIEAKIVK